MTGRQYGTFVNNSSQLKPGQHFAIMTFESVTIPGDERSRTNPGHGYPESTERYCKYEMFDTREAWEEEINRRTISPYIYSKNFVPLIVTVPEVKTTVTVAVD